MGEKEGGREMEKERRFNDGGRDGERLGLRKGE